MAGRLCYLLSIAFVAMAAAGCSATAPSRFYTLASTATADGTPAANYAVLVGPISIPASVDRAEFVVQIAPNRVDIDDFNRWAAPLNDGIARAVAGDLAVLLGTNDVAVAPLANFNHAYRVTIDVQRFDSIAGEAAIVEAVWAVHDIASGKVRSGRTTAREAVAGQGFDAMAAAHSRALAQVSGDIAEAIQRAQAEKAEVKPSRATAAKARHGSQPK